MFPIQDINHRVIGFGGRVMGDGKPKYLNSPETEIFDKSRNLYGLNFARTSRKGNVILCEGYMDVIAMHQAGFTQAVASLGTAFTSGQASLLRRYANEILLSYDSDGAGVNAALRAIGILKEAGMTGRVINWSLTRIRMNSLRRWAEKSSRNGWIMRRTAFLSCASCRRTSV